MRTLLSSAAALLLLVGIGCKPAVQPNLNANPVPPLETKAAFDVPVTFSIGETKTYVDDRLIVKLETINDSRCKGDVVCIWEGELAAVLKLGSNEGYTVTLGTSTKPTDSYENHQFTLDSITETTATITVTDLSTPPPVAGDCRPSGCSGQVCSDEDVVTDCMYREEYACYKTAKCERQASGECGWTPSAELTRCLAKPAGEAIE